MSPTFIGSLPSTSLVHRRECPPRIYGWVNGGGTAVGMLAEMLAAGLNTNVAGRDQMPIEVERQIVLWVRQMFGLPDTASGIFVTGTSMANLMGILVARSARIGPSVRQRGLLDRGAGLIAYTSVATHGCIAQAMDLAGFGTDALRRLRLIAVIASIPMRCVRRSASIAPRT